MPTPSWRHEPWPWLLMAGPAAVIVAGVITSVLAFQGADGLVADDYYKQGLGINRTLKREAAARALGIRAEVAFRDGRIEADLASTQALPDRVKLTLAHATRAAEDRVVWLARDASGRFTAPLAAPAAGHWTLILETPQWRHAARAELR